MKTIFHVLSAAGLLAAGTALYAQHEQKNDAQSVHEESDGRVWGKFEKSLNETKLHAACKKGDFERVKELVENEKMDVNAKNKFGETPLHFAAFEGALDVVKYLVAHGAQINAEMFQDDTPLDYAIEANKEEVMKYLVAQGGQYSIAGKRFDESELHITCRQKGTFSHIQKLVEEKNMDVNVTNKFGDTPLHYVCLRGDLPVVMYLLGHGAEMNAQNKFGETPLDYALDAEHSHVANYLIENGAKFTLNHKA